MFLTIKLYLSLTELLEIELFICMKMVLVLNNIQRLIFHRQGSFSTTYPKGGASYKKDLQRVWKDHHDIIHFVFIFNHKHSVKTYPVDGWNVYMDIFKENALHSSIGKLVAFYGISNLVD